MSSSAEPDRSHQIRQQMESLRAQLDRDVANVQFGARTLLDWHYYVRNYPWVCAVVSALVGYLVVPRKLEIRSPDAKTLEKLAREHRLVIESDPEAAPKSGLINSAFSFLSGLIMRTAMTQIGAQIAQTMDQIATRNSGNGRYKRKPTMHRPED